MKQYPQDTQARIFLANNHRCRLIEAQPMSGFSVRLSNAGRATMQRRRMFALLASAAIGGANVLPASATRDEGESSPAHLAWVAEVLKRMQTIKPGMTRKTLLRVFTTEGGLSTGLQRTFVSRDCPYFKIDVEFQAVGRSAEPRRERTGDASRRQRGHHSQNLYTVLAVQCYGLNSKQISTRRIDSPRTLSIWPTPDAYPDPGRRFL